MWRSIAHIRETHHWVKPTAQKILVRMLRLCRAAALYERIRAIVGQRLAEPRSGARACTAPDLEISGAHAGKGFEGMRLLCHVHRKGVELDPMRLATPLQNVEMVRSHPLSPIAA